MERIWQTVKYSAKCSFWVLLILALIQPFGIDTMKEGRMVFILIETLLAFLSICISDTISTIITGEAKEECTSRRSFVKHILIGNLINIPLLGAFLITFNSWNDTGDIATYWFWGGHFNLHPHFEMSSYVALLTVFMVFGQYLGFKNTSLKRELNEIKAINMMLEKRQEQLEIEEENQQANPSPDADEENMATITITGQGQDASLVLNTHKIIYVESMANYADICYISDNEIRHKTLRITLKQIRETLEDIESIVQCHRAFLVNINFVVSMTSRNTGYQLQLFGMDKQIPVSRANTDSIKAKLSK